MCANALAGRASDTRGRYRLRRWTVQQAAFRSQFGGLRLICVDSSEQMLERLSENLSGGGIRAFMTRPADVNELSLAGESLDAIIAFNAIHHFNVPGFLEMARHGLAVGGRLFIYTRTPEQNARCIWGRFFPGFTEKDVKVAHPPNGWKRGLPRRPALLYLRQNLFVTGGQRA